jgi:hypothetical protein
MKYISHKILQAGHIRIREMINNRIHGSVIAPNQPLEKYNDIIEADPDYEKYRTPENANAYEAMQQADAPTAAEKLEQWRISASLTRRKFMIGIKFYPWGKGTLEDAINTLREGLEEPMKTIIGLSLDESTHFDRMDADLIAMATAIGMSAEQVDEFYEWAENEGWRNN